MNYQGIYINLARDLDRRRLLEDELNRVQAAGLYERFEAVDGTRCGMAGNEADGHRLGNFLSHQAVIRQSLTAGRHMHIVEDDVVFSGDTVGVIDQVIASGTLGRYDLLFTDMGFRTKNFDVLRFFLEAQDQCSSPAPDGGLDFTSSSSCLVNKDALAKMDDLAGHPGGTDRPVAWAGHLDRWIAGGNLKAACVFPFLTSVDLRRMVGRDPGNPERPALSLRPDLLLRHLFFVGCDWDRILRLVPEAFHCGGGSRRDAFVLSLLNYQLFGDGPA
jgi:hypothetical protein